MTSEHPQAIVLDVMLPGYEGWGMLYRLKADPATSDIPVVIATSLEEQRLGLFLGANEYLVKPVAKSQLLQAIERVSLDPKPSVRNVAVVDDNPGVLRLVAQILEDKNYTVWTFESGEAFLASLPTQPPDAVIVDLRMPQGDGITVIECLKRNVQTAAIPIVVLTALHEPGLQRHVERIGASRYLTKPIHFNDLLCELERYIEVRIKPFEEQ